MQHIYSVMPLLKDHLDELAADAIDQYKRGITSCPLFIMYLQPEGNPVWDKAEQPCRNYAYVRDILKKEGVPSAILLQSTFGHGNAVSTPAPFQRMIGFTTGEETPVYCPMDPDTLAYLRRSVRRIAEEHPQAIMLDDDVRLLLRPFQGCACPRHMKEFNRRNNTDMTREELLQHVTTHPADDPLTLSFVKLQRETLVHAVTEIRAAIDEIDPSIQGINCTSGDECDTVTQTNPIFAGKNNPTIVRAPNGTYSPLTTKEFSDTMRRAAVCGSKLRKNGIDIVLAETDTVPFNRYSKNARYLHAHFTASILEGLRGAKHWITRTSSYEPKSGKAFRDILAQHSKFYDKLAEISENIRWVGANSAFIEQDNHIFHADNPKKIWRYHENTFATKVFERIALPFYFSDEFRGATFLEGTIVRDMTDEQLDAAFQSCVFLSSDAALDLQTRGRGDLLGITVREYTGGIVSGETFDGTMNKSCTAQKQYLELCIANENTEALSYCYRKVDNGIEILFPAVTRYHRGGGLTTTVFAGSPDTAFTYTAAFSFLNDTRRTQLIGLLKDAGALPVYCETDNEICLRAGYLKSGELLCALFILGFDPEEKVTLWLDNAPRSIQKLEKDGTYTEIPFHSLDNGFWELDVSAEPLYPLILVIS